MYDICLNNCFDLIEKYKRKLIDGTSIETSPDEMHALDSILFRFWQIGWLDKLEMSVSQLNDCIDRAEAQTAIQSVAKRYTMAHEAHGDGKVVWSDILIRLTDAMDALRDMPSAQPEQKKGQWTPCSEKMPEDGRYLCDYGDCIDFGRVTNGKWYVDGVIAWMPLPEPYKGEQHE